MTLTIAIFYYSLFALVVAARPIVPGNGSQSTLPSIAVQGAIQAVFQSRSRDIYKCLDCTDDQDAQIDVPSTESLTTEHITTAVPEIKDLNAINHALPIEESVNKNINSQQDADATSLSSSLHEGDGGIRPVLEEISPLATNLMPSTGEGGNFLTPSTDPGGSLFSQRHLLILVFSWATALISLGCVSAGLYVICRVRKRMLASNMAWELLPILEKRKYFHPDIERGDIGAPKNEKFQILFLEGPPRPSTANLDDTEEEKQEHYEMANDSFSDVGDPDTSPIDPGSPIPMTSFDKTEAAVEPGDSIPFIFIGAPNDSPDPDYLPLPCSPTPYSTPPPTPPRSPIRRPLQMREASPFAPVSKPAWSIRASDAHPLGLASSTTISARSSPIPFSRSLPPTRPSSPFVSLRIPGQLDPEPPALVSTTSELSPESADRRAYRAPVPELDIAFAMQLRPGFGLGADPAWLVRFLMAMFGWMTVLIGGGGNARS